MNANRKIIAVDFDGTLCENAWPEIGEERRKVVELAKEEKKLGSRLILWTCRCGEKLDEAIAWCRERGIEFDAINENLPERVAQYGSESRKISADEYWEDKAFGPDELELIHGIYFGTGFFSELGKLKRRAEKL